MGNGYNDEATNRTTRPAIALAFVILGSILAWALRSPDLSTLIIAVIGRFPQLLDPSLRLEGVVVLRGQIELLQNFSTQILAKSDWVTGEMRPRPVAVGIRLKFLLTVAITDISIIVPTWNEEKYLAKCLDSLVNQSWHGSFEIIVVDGGSPDRTVRIAEKYADKVLLKARQPVGCARNLGAKEAKGEILAFIDADTIASHSWLEEIATGIRCESNLVGVTGPTLPYEGTQLDRLAYHIATGWVQRVSFKLGLPHVAGFNCAYRKGAFWKAGGFDERRELSEDVMLGLRIRHQGRISFNPDMVAYTSIRRIKKYGYPYLTTYYMINAISMLFLGKTLAYPKVR